jgi:hypothetical protein
MSFPRASFKTVISYVRLSGGFRNKMRLRILLLLWIVLLMFLPFNAIAGSGCGTNWLGSDIDDPDFYVSRNQNLGASRSDMSMPATNPRPQNPTNTSDENVQVAAPSNQEPPKPEPPKPEPPKPEPPKPEPPDLNGKWSMRFDGVGGRSMDLIFIQTGKTIMGSGMLNEGSDKLQLTASGSLEKNDLKLNLKTVVGDFVNKIDKRYKLDLILDNRTLSGSYDEYSGDTFVGKGNVTLSQLGF